jgi:murein L,D-transpeptidase YcbB/YkuD
MRIQPVYWLVVVAAILAPACSRSRDARPDPTTAGAATHALQTALDAKARPAFVGGDDEGSHVWQEERRFYKQTGYQLAWSNGSRPNSRMDSLVTAIRAADQEGLEPSDFGADEIAAYRQSTFDATRAAEIDLRCTYAYLRYGWQLTHGTIDPEDVDPQWHAVDRNVDLHGTLQNALDEAGVAESLQALAPTAAQYQGLKHQLARYRQIAAKGGWSAAPPAEIQGEDTHVPIEDRVQQIAFNMERWRWLPDDLGTRYLLVNIPAFKLDVIENGRSVLAMNVVTGKKDSPTPVLADRMAYVVFSPYWNIPSDIVQKETIPHAMKDPAYLEKNNMELVQGSGNHVTPVDPASVDWSNADRAGLRIRQKPGKGNSLGLVKFIFPNHFNVYLHDTPAQALFNRIERDFSHGCVRLERPLDLAKYVLRDQPDWTEEKITAAMNAGTEQSVSLKQPLPVYLLYFTAWEEGGHLQTRPDVYGYDRRHRAAADPQ